MKNFIFALCGCLMMSLVSLNVQASGVSEPIPCKSDVSVDVGLPMIQTDVVTISANYFVLTAPQPVIKNAESQDMQSSQMVVPKCPFRYVYKSKYCTHYSYTAYSKLITPY